MHSDASHYRTVTTPSPSTRREEQGRDGRHYSRTIANKNPKTHLDIHGLVHDVDIATKVRKCRGGHPDFVWVTAGLHAGRGVDCVNARGGLGSVSEKAKC